MEMVLVFAGGVVCLAVFLWGMVNSGVCVCPACGERILMNRATNREMRFGRILCPRCGNSVEADL